MNDHADSSHLTKLDAFRVNKHHITDLKTMAKSIQTSVMLRQRPPGM